VAEDTGIDWRGFTTYCDAARGYEVEISTCGRFQRHRQRSRPLPGEDRERALVGAWLPGPPPLPTRKPS
jgi:hypothetical protein